MKNNLNLYCGSLNQKLNLCAHALLLSRVVMMPSLLSWHPDNSLFSVKTRTQELSWYWFNKVAILTILGVQWNVYSYSDDCIVCWYSLMKIVLFSQSSVSLVVNSLTKTVVSDTTFIRLIHLRKKHNWILELIVAWLSHMMFDILVNTFSGMLPDGTKPLLESMLTWDYCNPSQ